MAPCTKVIFVGGEGIDFGEGQSSAGEGGGGEGRESLLSLGSVDLNYMWRDRACKAGMHREKPFGTENVGQVGYVLFENFQTNVYRSPVTGPVSARDFPLQRTERIQPLKSQIIKLGPG